MRTGALLLFMAVSGLLVAAFFDAATLHGGYSLPRSGMSSVPREELAFLFWYLLWGTLAVAALAAAFHARGARSLVSMYERVAPYPRECIVCAALLVFTLVLGLRHYLLLAQPIADDELVYELTAKNLALGRLTSVPPLDPVFLQNQFVIVDAQHWHGMYPIGHSALLAPFELLGRADLLGALLAVCSLALTFAVGRRFVGERVALFGALLLACSPHFLLTHATLLSQTTSSACMLLAALATLRHRETRAARWLVLLGFSLGFGILARPFPSLLVAAVLLLDKGVELAREPGALSGKALSCLSCLLPLALVFASLLLTNLRQSGSPWTSGYHSAHGELGMFENIDGELTNSVGGAIVRENAWLLGWPCSFVFLAFARVKTFPRLFWSLVLTGLVYRLMVPKTVVATTGPVYVTELVPWLCLASAAGASRVMALLSKLELSAPRERVAAIIAAAFVIALVTFVPVQFRAIHRSASAREQVFQQIRDEGISRALIFGDLLVAPESGLSWAYGPPNPWPDLRDELLFLRVPAVPEGLDQAWTLWRSKFSDRPALLLVPAAQGVGLIRLDAQQRPTLGVVQSLVSRQAAPR